MDEEEYDRVLATNLKGPIFLAQAVAQQMIDQKTSGYIINIGSTSAYRPDSVVSYGPAKMAMVSLKFATYPTIQI